MPEYDDTDFDTANERLLDTSKNEDKLMGDLISNKENFKKYWSFSSNSILSQNHIEKDENKNNFIVRYFM